MIIWLYCIILNEEKILPYTLRHYETFVDKMLFFDGGSTDRTKEMISANPKCELHDWTGGIGMVDDEFTDFANSKWKEARGIADWIIWIDADEFIYHPRILEVLKGYMDEGVEVPQTQGYMMVSKSFPTTTGQIYDEVRTGFKDDRWCKKAVFRPHVEMKFQPGRHGVEPSVEKYKWSSNADLKLLHYRALGLDYIIPRNRGNWSRVPERCRKKNLGVNHAPENKGLHSDHWYKEIVKQEFPEVI